MTEFFIPFLGVTLNRLIGVNRFKYRALKKELEAICLAEGLKELPVFNSPVSLTFQPHLGKGKRSWDCTNYAGTTKMIEDCLVGMGILPDDRSSVVRSITIRAPVRTGVTGMLVGIQYE